MKLYRYKSRMKFYREKSLPYEKVKFKFLLMSMFTFDYQTHACQLFLTQMWEIHGSDVGDLGSLDLGCLAVWNCIINSSR